MNIKELKIKDYGTIPFPKIIKYKNGKYWPDNSRIFKKLLRKIYKLGKYNKKVQNE